MGLKAMVNIIPAEKRDWMDKEKDLQAQAEWTDGELADYPADHDPDTHITAGIQEVYNLHPVDDEESQP
jgi:hypothetical protein